MSSSWGQANFRGLEAKPKDLSYEAKAKPKDLINEAKDFKMCPRGQGRPRGLRRALVIVSDPKK